MSPLGWKAASSGGKDMGSAAQHTSLSQRPETSYPRPLFPARHGPLAEMTTPKI